MTNEKQKKEQGRWAICFVVACCALMVFMLFLFTRAVQAKHDAIVALRAQTHANEELVGTISIINKVLEDNPEFTCREAQVALGLIIDDVELWPPEMMDDITIIIEIKTDEFGNMPITLPDPDTELED